MKKFDIEAFDPNMAPGATRDGNLIWLPPDTPPMRLDGFAFRRPGGPFRRLDFDPGLPEAINALAGHTAGGMLSFRSDTLTIALMIYNGVLNGRNLPYYSAFGLALSVIGVPIILVIKWALGKVYADVEY